MKKGFFKSASDFISNIFKTITCRVVFSETQLNPVEKFLLRHEHSFNIFDNFDNRGEVKYSGISEDWFGAFLKKWFNFSNFETS